MKKNNVSTFLAQHNVQEQLKNLVGNKSQELTSNLVAITEASPKLKECEQGELLRVAINATSLNLPLNKNLGYAYIIPYEVKEYNQQTKKRETVRVEPQFQIGYKGLIQLALRTNKYQTINVCEVRENEIKRNKFTGSVDFIEEYPDNEIIGYLAYFKLLNGFEQSFYMTVEAIENHADKYSQSFNKETNQKIKNGEMEQKEMWRYSSPWYKEFDLMAKKTVLKQLLSKYGVLETDLSKAIQIDQATSNGYVDNPNYKKETIIDADIEEDVFIPAEHHFKAPEEEKITLDDF